MVFLELVLSFFLLPFSQCISNLSQGGEYFRVSPDAICLCCHLGCLVVVLVPPNTYLSLLSVDLYSYSPLFQPLS